MRAIDFGGVTNHLSRPVDWDEAKNGERDSIEDRTLDQIHTNPPRGAVH